MTEAIDTLKAYWWLVAGPVALVWTGAHFWLKTQFATKKEIKAEREDVAASIQALCDSFNTHADETDQRLVKLETTIAHLPSAEAFNALMVMVEKQGTMIEAMRETQRGTSEGVKRIEEYFIKKAP